MFRFFKQLIYGLLFLAILGIIGFGIYKLRKPLPSCFDNLKNQNEEEVDCGGDCINCEFKNLKLEIHEVEIIPVGNKTSLIVKVKNLSKNFGSELISYDFVIFSSFGIKMKTITGSTYINPEEIKYVAIIGSDIGREDIGRVEFKIKDISWKEASKIPVLKARVENLSIDNASKISGEIYNFGPIILPKIKIQAFIFDPDNKIIGVSQTQMENLGTPERQGFELLIPNLDLKEASLNQIKIYLEVFPK